MIRLLFFTTLLFFSCCINRCEGKQEANINDNMSSPESEDHLSVIYSDVIRDSLSHFIESVKETPRAEGYTIYTIDFTLYKKDTLISFYGYNSAIYESDPFSDARVILKMIDNDDILVTYSNDLMRLYTLVGDTTGEFSAYGAKKMNGDSILAYTAHNISQVDKFISSKDFDKFTYENSELFPLEDRGPVVKIYKYQQDKGLELIGQQDPRGMPYRK